MSELHNLDAERSLLASLNLEDRSVCIDERDFYAPAHRLIYRAIESLRSRGVTPNMVTVADELGADLTAVGDKSYLVDVFTSEVTSTNAASYAKIVRDHAEARRVVSACDRIKVAKQTGTDIDVFREIEDATSTTGGTSRHVSHLLRERLATLGEGREHITVEGYEVDLHPRDLCFLAGRPGVGKSAFALQFVASLAERGISTRVYSLEMSSGDWLDRLIQQKTPFDTRDFDRGLDDERFAFVERAMADVSAWPLEVSDRNLGVGALCADLRRFARRGGKVAVIDYIGLLVGASRNETRYQAVTEASRLLKVTAMESDLLIVALSQLNRASVDIKGKIRAPVLSDLRESGALEQDADDVILLHRFEKKDVEDRQDLRNEGYILDREDELPLCLINFAKARRGKPKRRPAYFDGADMRFIPLDREA